MQVTAPLHRKQRGTKEPLDESERGQIPYDITSNCQHLLHYRKGKQIPKKSTSASLTMLMPLCGSQQIVENS